MRISHRPAEKLSFVNKPAAAQIRHDEYRPNSAADRIWESSNEDLAACRDGARFRGGHEPVAGFGRPIWRPRRLKRNAALGMAIPLRGPSPALRGSLGLAEIARLTSGLG